MGAHIANQIIKLMLKKNITVINSRILILGITFKENCPDIRNSHVVDVIRELKEFGCHIDVYDPWADPDDVKKMYGIELIPSLAFSDYNAIILAVAHNKFSSLDITKHNHQVIYDIKSFLPRELVDGRL
jgi:UDP-N-acetyl-D-galactosamine dehydrogenase